METNRSCSGITCLILKHAHIKDVLGAVVGVGIMLILSAFLLDMGTQFIDFLRNLLI